jgi:hypothetical protein
MSCDVVKTDLQQLQREDDISVDTTSFTSGTECVHVNADISGCDSDPPAGNSVTTDIVYVQFSVDLLLFRIRV